MNEANQHIKAVSEHYDKLAANGPYGTLAPHNRGGRKSQYVAAVFDSALLASLDSQSTGRILDFGCGTGLFSSKAAAFADEVVGVDVSEGVLTQAKLVCRGLANVCFAHMDGTHIPLPNGSVDVVIAREVLCYVPDAQLPQMLKEIRRVTKPGGRFLWLEQVSRTAFWQRHPDAPDLVKRDPGSIHAMAESSGWNVQSETVVRTPRFPWIYPVWFGLVPRRLIPVLAHWEVTLHSRRSRPSGMRRWWNTLFELRNPSDG